MRIIVDTDSLIQAQGLASTAAHIAHEAQPYPQDSEVFKGLAKLANAMSAALLRCLEASLSPVEAQPNEEPADTLLGQDSGNEQDQAPLG